MPLSVSEDLPSSVHLTHAKHAASVREESAPAVPGVPAVDKLKPQKVDAQDVAAPAEEIAA